MRLLDSGIERLLGGSELPPPLHEAVRRAVGAARLPRGERVDFARELVHHFEDGLTEGRAAGELLEEFGDPAVGGRLAGRARRRGPRAAARRLGRVFAASTGALALAYVLAFAQLRGEAPGQRTAEETLRSVASAARLEAEARRLIVEARSAAERGDGLTARTAAGQAAARVGALAAAPQPFARVGATALLGELAPVLGAAPGRPTSSVADAVPPVDLAPLLTRAGAVDLAAFSGWLEDFLARVYADPGAGGRLTGDGLRLVRALKGGDAFTRGAALLEPVYFAAPAPLEEVRGHARRLLRLAAATQGMPGDPAALAEFDQELRRLERGPGPAGARYYPLTLVMRRLHAALEAERRLAPLSGE